MHAETIWLPAVLLGDDVRWTELDGHPHATVRAHGEPSEVDFDVAADGEVRSVSLPRWGDPAPEPLGYHPFGGLTSDPIEVDGFRIPTRHRVGWFFGTERFDEGEFFRCTVRRVRFKL